MGHNFPVNNLFSIMGYIPLLGKNLVDLDICIDHHVAMVSKNHEGCVVIVSCFLHSFYDFSDLFIHKIYGMEYFLCLNTTVVSLVIHI